ncbi:MAG TPA: putative baseplate assembly protein, partial [Bryobacteraceae bacterium]|nr:putative baseplate assembly protein [Bryobacteraceae bacterium]
ETVRQRISAKRHARLVDYRMHDGRNAATWVHVAVSADLPLPQGSKFVSRLFSPLAHQSSPPGVVIDDALITVDTLETDSALVSAVVFEAAHPAQLDHHNNLIRIHTWGNQECCLPAGTREAFLYTVLPGSDAVVLPALHAGDYLLFEEVKGPLTGADADADPTHRAIVRLEEEPAVTEDPVYADTLAAGDVRRRLAGDPALPLLHVRWRREDALAFPLCLSARPAGQGLIRDVAVARGNLVLADHGITTSESLELPGTVSGDVPFRLRLSHGPLTQQCEPDTVNYDPATARLATARMDLTCDVREARPAVAVLATFPTGPELWTPVPDLLDSPPFAQQFVAEVDDDGRAVLRFGDGEYGREIAGATAFEAVYRVGNGAAGNVGAEAIAHVALAPGATVLEVRNPLAASRGIDPETIEEVRRRAPEAFRAEQFRAVTAADYVAAAKKLPEVAGAFAAFRWTESWYTVFVSIDPRDPADLIRRPRGLAILSPDLEKRVRAFLTRYRLAGYDMEIRPPTFVPLELELQVCAAPDHFRADVTRAVLDALSNRVLPDGTRGFFHPDHFTFGQPVYLSQIYAAAAGVEGVESVEVLVFRRAGHTDNGELASGVLPIGPSEIAILDNDPNFMENGVLRVTTRGGKG